MQKSEKCCGEREEKQKMANNNKTHTHTDLYTYIHTDIYKHPRTDWLELVLIAVFAANQAVPIVCVALKLRNGVGIVNVLDLTVLIKKILIFNFTL